MRRYFPLLTKYKLNLAVLTIISISASITGIVSVYYSGRYIDVVIDSSDIHPIFVICTIIFAIALLGLVMSFFNTIMKMFMNEKLIFDFKMKALEHLRGISVLKLKDFDPSYLSKRIDEDSQQIVRFFTDNYVAVFLRGVELVVVSVLILSINFSIGVLMMFLCPIYFIIYRMFKKPIFDRSLEAREKSAEFFNEYTHHLGIMENSIIKSEFDKDDVQIKSSFATFFGKYKSFIFVSAKLNLSQGLVVSLMQLIVFLIGGQSVLNGSTTIGLLTTLMIYFSQLLGNISYYLELARKGQVNRSSLHRMSEILDIPAEHDGSERLDGVSSINARVRFSMGGKCILNDVQLHCKKSELIGILGENGTGKSTLSKILAGIIRLVDDDSYVLINGSHKTSELDMGHFRAVHLSYIHQSNLHRSVSMGEALCDGAADVDSYISSLCEIGIPLCDSVADFLRSSWGIRVNELSGGDRQLISILHGVAKHNADVIIMDEPTANLDEPRVDWLKNVLRFLKKGRIVMVVTHDKSIRDVFDRTVILGVSDE